MYLFVNPEHNCDGDVKTCIGTSSAFPFERQHVSQGKGEITGFLANPVRKACSASSTLKFVKPCCIVLLTTRVACAR